MPLPYANDSLHYSLVHQSPSSAARSSRWWLFHFVLFVCFFPFFRNETKTTTTKKGPCVNEGDLKLVFKDIETHTHTQRNEAIGMRCRPGLSVINVVQNGGRTDERFRLDFSFFF